MFTLRKTVTFDGENNRFLTYLSICKFEKHDVVESFKNRLSDRERVYYDIAAFKRKKTLLLGRIAAKNSIEGYVPGAIHSDIVIDTGVFDQPVVTMGKNIQVSITHTNDCGVAVAFHESLPIGIDLEDIERARIIDNYLTDFERSIRERYEKAIFYAIAWTAKEALSKCLKTGLTTPFSVYEICTLKNRNMYIECSFKNFSQYKALCFKKKNCMFAIVFPKKTTLTQKGMDGIKQILEMV